MKIELTEKWHNRKDSFILEAMWHHVELECTSEWPGKHIKYVGSARLTSPHIISILGIKIHGLVHKRIGKFHDRPHRAKKEAERLAVELIRDVVFAAEELKKQYGINEEN